MLRRAPLRSVLTTTLAATLLTGCAVTPEPGRYLLDLQTGTLGATTVEVALDLDRAPNGDWSGAIINGPERIEIPAVTRTKSGVELGFPHYDSTLALTFEQQHGVWALDGTWTKERGKDLPAVIPVQGKPIIDPSISRSAPIHTEPALNEKTSGRYAVDFTDSGPAILDLEIAKDGTALATVLTPTGDYRYLVGRLDPRIPRRSVDERFHPDTRPLATLYLSTFDGAHMFAFTGTLRDDAAIEGFFYSGDWWVEPYLATPDPEAVLPDAFAETTWTDAASLEALVYSDLDGNPTSVAELIRRAHADNPNANANGFGPTIIEVFGSWCPNCHDAAAYLAELQSTHRSRGLRIVGLAFELTPDLDRSITQVNAYKARHNIDWPVLVAGISDKSRATEAFPVLDRVRSYPTAIFLNPAGEVIGIHTGFTGPATGDAYHRMRATYDDLIEQLLHDAD